MKSKSGKRNRLYMVMLVFIMALSVMAGCAPAAEKAPAGGADGGKAAASAGDFKVALLTPGPINDNGWNATAYQGLMKIKEELQAKTAYSENVSQSDMEEFLRGYANDGYSIVIGHGFEFADTMKRLAKDFPKTWFLVTSTTVSQEPNLASISTNNREQGYLMGTVAALMSKSKTVAAIGGQEIPPILNSVKGFEDGAKAADPSIKVITTMTGSSNDVAKAKETAISFIEKGADVVMTNANQAGLGGIEAAKQKGVLAIGSNQDQNVNGPDTVVVSVIQDYPKAMAVVAKRVKDNLMKAEALQLGVKEGAIYLSSFHSFDGKISKETKDKIAKVVTDLSEGKIVVKNE